MVYLALIGIGKDNKAALTFSFWIFLNDKNV